MALDGTCLLDFEKPSQHGFWPMGQNITFFQPLGHIIWSAFEWSSSNLWLIMTIFLVAIAGLATYICQKYHLPMNEVKDLNGDRMREMMEARNRQQVRANYVLSFNFKYL